MPRPERIEYEDAYYHVMNRGRDRGRIKIFHSQKYFEAFIQTLSEAVERFGLVVHGYCLCSRPNYHRTFYQIIGPKIRHFYDQIAHFDHNYFCNSQLKI